MKKNIKKYLILFILFMLIIFCCFLIYNKHNIDNFDNKDNDKNKNSERNNDQLFSEYLGSFPLNNFNMIGNNYSASDLNQDMINNYVYNVYKYIFMENDIVSYDEINNYINHIFGNNFNVARDDILYNEDIKEYCLIYDEKDMVFTHNSKCVTDIDNYIALDVIVDKYADDNKRSIDAVHYYLFEGKIYCSYQDYLDRKFKYTFEVNKLKETLSDLENNPDKYKCVKRRYTFNLKDNKYEFYSSEILNN